MDYLLDVYKKKPELLTNLFEQKVTISLKVDGSAFQIAYNDDTDEIEYHKRGGDANHLGPIIDDYSKLFSKHLDKAVQTFEKKKDVLDYYRFLAIEIFNGLYVLLMAIENDGTIIDNPNDLKEIANKLEIDTVPVFFEGNLTQEQQDGLIAMLSLEDATTSEEFIKYLTDLFGEVDMSKFLKGKGEIEGVVLSFALDEKVAQYKIINPAFKVQHDKELANEKVNAEKYAAAIEELATLFVDNLKPEKLSANKLENLEKNFMKMIEDGKLANKIMNAANKLGVNKNEFFRLRPEKTSKEMQLLLKRCGQQMVTAYENFVKLFYKAKKRGYVVSKEFQEKINEIVGKL